LIVVFVLSGVLSFLAEGASGQTAARDKQLIARQRDYQKRARRLMQELLQGVLQRHLKQLEENKMGNLQIYNDLKDMQKRSTALAGTQMKEAVALLSEAYLLKDSARADKYKQAQTKMHQILLRILAERERLRLRRQLAELVERVRSLIGGQKFLQRKTLELNVERGETATTGALHSQKALRQMSLRLVKVLKSAADQSGDVGAMAGDAGRTMQKVGITAGMGRAVEQLTAADFAGAAETQRGIIVGLEKVLAALLISTRHSLKLAQEQVIKILERQERLLKSVSSQQFTDANATQWVTGQGGITESLRSIIALVGTSETCIRLADLGVSASESARRALFIKEKTQASSTRNSWRPGIKLPRPSRNTTRAPKSPVAMRLKHPE